MINKALIFIGHNYIRLSLLFVFTVYLLTVRGFAGNVDLKDLNSSGQNHTPPFETSLERGRFAQTVSLSVDHIFNVDKYTGFLKPDLAWYNGHFYPAFPPGISLLAVPFYILGTKIGLNQVLTYFTTTLFSLLTGFVILKICRELKLSRSTAVLSLIIFSFGSCVWSYSVTLSAHPVSAFFIALAFYLYLRIKKGQQNFLLFISLWIIYGLNFFVDFPNLVILLPILIAAFGKAIYLRSDTDNINVFIPMSFIYSIIGLIFALAPYIFFSYANYGKPIAFTNTYNLRRLEIQGIHYSYDSLSNQLFSQKPYAGRFNPSKLLKGSNILLTSSDRGLFVYFPIFIFVFVGIYYAVRQKQGMWIVVILSFLADLLIYGTFDDPWGGWSFGPRYLIPVLPLLTVLVGFAIESLLRRGFLMKALITFLLVYSIAVSQLGSLTTNAVPPSVEAPYLGMGDNFLLNLSYMQNGMNSSFLFNTVFSRLMSNASYYIAIFMSLTVGILFLIWNPFEKRKQQPW